MRWIFNFSDTLFRFARPSVEDEAFVGLLEPVLAGILEEIRILEKSGVLQARPDTDREVERPRTDEEIQRDMTYHHQGARAIQSHIQTLQVARAKLLNSRPKWEHRHLRGQALHLSAVYLKVLGACVAKRYLLPYIAENETVTRQYFKAVRDAQLWDQITHRSAVRMVSLLKGTQLNIGITESLENMANEFLAKAWGAVTSSGEIFQR